MVFGRQDSESSSSEGSVSEGGSNVTGEVSRVSEGR